MGGCCGVQRSTAAQSAYATERPSASAMRPTDAGWLGVVELHVEQARSLLAKDVGGTSDPFAVITFGPESWRTRTVLKTLTPVWNETIALPASQHSKAWALKISVYDADKMSQNDFIGSVIADFDGALSKPVTSQWLPLVGKQDEPAGEICISMSFRPKAELEKYFWTEMAKFFDADGNGVISPTEMSAMMQCIDADMTDAEIRALFAAADTNKDGSVSPDELVALMQRASGPVFANFRKCPLTGRDFNHALDSEVICHLAVEFQKRAPGDGARAFAVGGFLSEDFASRGWYARVGAAVGESDKICSNPEFVVVMDRETGHVNEEFIPGSIKQALRMIYQTAIGSAAASTDRVRRLLRHMTDQYGKRFSSPDSVAEIPKFIALHKLNVEEILDPLDSFKNFNEFFFRKLKPNARPIDSPDDSSVAVSGADSRCTVFASVSAATELWIKGDKFTVAALLGNQPTLAARFELGALCIFRLAPQDYHRFHCPVDATIVSLSDAVGQDMYTVNPMAIRHPKFNVYTENKRVLCQLQSDVFGLVMFIAVGATMVGSVNFTAKVGDKLRKGDELGYFAFGGSTCICLFEPGKLAFSDDLLANSRRPLETLIRMGSRLGAVPAPGASAPASLSASLAAPAASE